EGLESAPLPNFQKAAQAAESQAPSFIETLQAGFHSGNFLGELDRRLSLGTLQPEGEAEEGFNPIEHIPAGYLHDYGSRFLDARNMAQIAQTQRQIDAERADQGILSRSSTGRALASSLASGLTDPISLATMAFVPEAAPP